MFQIIAIRIGITGTPGVGKSTFIESFGNLLINNGLKVAVLAIDPSSTETKGSILGDKSRMIMLYALCGFANFSSVGILLSGLSSMVPERRADLISVSGKALWCALLASCLTGFIIGIL